MNSIMLDACGVSPQCLSMFHASRNKLSSRKIASVQWRQHLAYYPKCGSIQMVFGHQSHSSSGTTKPYRASKTITLATAAEPARSSPSAGRALEDLDMTPVVTLQGYILPKIPPNTEATVFGIYDQAKILQYVGFSKDLRASLRTVFSRRPDKCHFFRALHLPTLDQQEMVDIRSAWFDENAGPPPGNRLPAERTAWQSPPQALAISDRGKVASAEELAKQMLIKIRFRGCKEDFIANPDALAQGQVDFLQADAVSDEILARQKEAAAAASLLTRKCLVEIDGEIVPYEIFFKNTLKTNGGYMFDLNVTFQEKDSTHRVIVGKAYFNQEKEGRKAEDTVERIFSFLLKKRMPRHTEGIMGITEFPINYFSMTEVHQYFADFEEAFAQYEIPGEDSFWRFNRTKDYGYKGEDNQKLADQFALPIEDED